MGLVEKLRVKEIVKHFNFNSLDDFVLRMNEVLGHKRQEVPGEIVADDNTNPKQVVNDVYKRIKSGEYKRLIGWCAHFANLTKKIAEYFGEKGSVEHYNVLYLNPEKPTHHYVFEKSDGIVMDGSIYNSYASNYTLDMINIDRVAIRERVDRTSQDDRFVF
ncbi:MAG: hypothetical protein JW791_02740 [Nanoarchaeota archaeon]|nr:hypothetical protein [Nanoarchaeota archaeon]